MHKGLNHCLFSAGPSEMRVVISSRCFDESWLQIRSRAKDLLAAVNREKETLVAWQGSLPDAALLAGDLQPVYDESVARATGEMEERMTALEAVKRALDVKVDDPSATPEVLDRAVLTEALPVTVLARAIAEHNHQARRHEEVTAARKETVLDHLVGSQSQAFCDLETQAKDAQTKSETSRKAAGLAERRLEEVRQEQFREYWDGLARAGFTSITIMPTHQVAGGMHSAIIRAVNA